ncbi:MAG: ATP-binding cassette domain-containing protein [Planctomycetia bacterium]|nr:ATP-binding cassette domain-containing protein [Planctomycetia bacterium]
MTDVPVAMELESDERVRITRLSKVYPGTGSDGSDRIAVRNVSFSASRGEVVGILGLNGAGKTTVLRILATLLTPTAGKASICGRDTVREPLEVRRRLGFVSAGTSGYDRMTAREMILFFGRLHAIAEQKLRDRLEELSERLRITPFLDRFVAGLSTGMRQKVSVARALIHDPPVLIFDEATSGLDVPAAGELRRMVRELRDAGRCILWSTHTMSEVGKLCDRVVVLKEGRLLRTSTVDELRAEADGMDPDDFFERLLVCDEPVVT